MSVDAALNAVSVNSFGQASFQNTVLKDVGTRLVSIAIGMPGLHRGSVNDFVQIGAYDNQKENYKH
jgi:hypothetical protein